MKNQCQIHWKRTKQRTDMSRSDQGIKCAIFDFTRSTEIDRYHMVKSTCDTSTVCMWIRCPCECTACFHTRIRSQSQNDSVYMFILSFFSLHSGSFPSNIWGMCKFFLCLSVDSNPNTSSGENNHIGRLSRCWALLADSGLFKKESLCSRIVQNNSRTTHSHRSCK